MEVIQCLSANRFIINFLDFNPNFIGLTGTPDQINKLAKEYRIYYKTAKTSDDNDYLIDHSIYYFLIGKDGQMIRYFGKNTAPEKCAQEIETAIREQSNTK